MPNRPEDLDPPLPVWLGHTPSWTGGDVLLWMKRFFSTDPRTRSVAEARPIAWPNDYLSTADPDWTIKRDILLGWARCRAQKTSFQEEIRRHPSTWGSPATVYRLRDDAAAKIAEGINAAIVKAASCAMDRERTSRARGDELKDYFPNNRQAAQ